MVLVLDDGHCDLASGFGDSCKCRVETGAVLNRLSKEGLLNCHNLQCGWIDAGPNLAGLSVASTDRRTEPAHDEYLGFESIY